MQKEFVTYEIALKLKELSFNEECLAVYPGDSEIQFTLLNKSRFINDKSSWVTAPLWQQCINWLRIEHRLAVIYDLHDEMSCSYDPHEEHFRFKLVRITQSGTRNAWEFWLRGKDFNSYQEGLEFTILEAIKLINKTK